MSIKPKVLRSDSKRKTVYSLSLVLWGFHMHSLTSTILNLHLKTQAVTLRGEKWSVHREGEWQSQNGSSRPPASMLSNVTPCKYS